MAKAIITIVCSIVGAIIGVIIDQGIFEPSVWLLSGLGGNLAVEALDGFPIYNNGRASGSFSFLQALGGTLLFLILKSIAGPIFPIKNIIRFFRGE